MAGFAHSIRISVTAVPPAAIVPAQIMDRGTPVGSQTHNVTANAIYHYVLTIARSYVYALAQELSPHRAPPTDSPARHQFA